MRYYGQFNPPVDQVIHERYFPNFMNGISIECGAFDGLLENCTKFFEENYNWKTINIEPVNRIFNNLVINRPNSINLNIALSNEQSIKKIRVYDIGGDMGIDNGMGSICHTESHRISLENMSGNKFIEQDTETKTYKQIISELGINKLDLFILDVEGHEIEVLEGMIGCDILPDVFVIEHGHREVGFFDPYLEKLNAKYKLDFVSHVNSFYVKI